MSRSAILVHGGAGAWGRIPVRLAEAQAACEQAAAVGQAVLRAGGSALDAVEAAVRLLEDCPVLDAGRGSYPTTEGKIEMDALIMSGEDLALGAVACVGGLRHPVSLARRVMQDSPHCLLVASGAEAFADRIGFPRCEEEALRVSLPPEGDADEGEAPADGSAAQPMGAVGDTVGAVARDHEGRLAVATSTGGMRGQLPGRVGDSPLAGAGGYADSRTAAVGSTGQGEALMKLLSCKRVADLVGQGMALPAACRAAIAELDARFGAPGGLIAVDLAGRLAWACNTEAMPVAWAIDAEPVRGCSGATPGDIDPTV